MAVQNHLRIILDGHGGRCLYSQHLVGKSKQSSMSLKLAWSTQWVIDKPELHSETTSFWPTSLNPQENGAREDLPIKDLGLGSQHIGQLTILYNSSSREIQCLQPPRTPNSHAHSPTQTLYIHIIKIIKIKPQGKEVNLPFSLRRDYLYLSK